MTSPTLPNAQDITASWVPAHKDIGTWCFKYRNSGQIFHGTEFWTTGGGSTIEDAKKAAIQLFGAKKASKIQFPHK